MAALLPECNVAPSRVREQGTRRPRSICGIDQNGVPRQTLASASTGQDDESRDVPSQICLQADGRTVRQCGDDFAVLVGDDGWDADALHLGDFMV